MCGLVRKNIISKDQTKLLKTKKRFKRKRYTWHQNISFIPKFNQMRSQVSPSVAIAEHKFLVHSKSRREGGLVSFFNICSRTHMGFRKIKFIEFGGEEHVRITMFLFWTCYIQCLLRKMPKITKFLKFLAMQAKIRQL